MKTSANYAFGFSSPLPPFTTAKAIQPRRAKRFQTLAPYESAGFPLLDEFLMTTRYKIQTERHISVVASSLSSSQSHMSNHTTTIFTTFAMSFIWHCKPRLIIKIIFDQKKWVSKTLVLFIIFSVNPNYSDQVSVCF